MTELRESNITAQKFFYECGFRAGRIAGPLVRWFGTEDAVAMRPAVLPVATQKLSGKFLRTNRSYHTAVV
ncbi:MAG TPA: hypothetical protein VMP01_02260 [Pirellulaceae bacterium]|nr:hypothetical protein [Pirellulaceae bacterium]